MVVPISKMSTYSCSSEKIVCRSFCRSVKSSICSLSCMIFKMIFFSLFCCAKFLSSGSFSISQSFKRSKTASTSSSSKSSCVRADSRSKSTPKEKKCVMSISFLLTKGIASRESGRKISAEIIVYKRELRSFFRIFFLKSLSVSSAGWSE